VTRDRLEQFLDTLRRARWNVVTMRDDTLDLNNLLSGRYSRIPDAYLTFLRHVAECSNPAQNAWFLCAADYNADGRDSTTFRWNEWERMSLDAAEGDEELIQNVTQFWDCHLPILSAVHSDYAYLAIALAADEYGSLVYGYGPEFEESARKVCASFDAFLDLFEGMVAGEVPVTYQDASGVTLIRREFSDFL